MLLQLNYVYIHFSSPRNIAICFINTLSFEIAVFFNILFFILTVFIYNL